MQAQAVPGTASGINAKGLLSLIDPGGYASPANAAAAAGLITAMADIRRSQNATELSLVRDEACSRPAAGGESLDRPGTMIREKRFEEAAKLLLSNPGDRKGTTALRLLAMADEGLGKFTDAAASYTSAAEASAQEADFFGAGYEFILAGLPAEAMKSFGAGLAKHPGSTVLLLGAGSADFLMGHTSEAMSRFLSAADKSPADPQAYGFLGICFDFAGEQAPHVRALLKQHLDSSPRDAQAHNLYATALLHGNSTEPVDSARVEALLKRAIALDDNLADAHFQLGTFYARQGDFAGAVRQFETTTRLDPERNEARFRLAAAYRRTGHVEAAEREMKDFQEARAGKGKGSQALARYVSVFDRPGQPAVSRPDSCVALPAQRQ